MYEFINMFLYFKMIMYTSFDLLARVEISVKINQKYSYKNHKAEIILKENKQHKILGEKW